MALAEKAGTKSWATAAMLKSSGRQTRRCWSRLARQAAATGDWTVQCWTENNQAMAHEGSRTVPRLWRYASQFESTVCSLCALWAPSRHLPSRHWVS